MKSTGKLCDSLLPLYWVIIFDLLSVFEVRVFAGERSRCERATLPVRFSL